MKNLITLLNATLQEWQNLYDLSAAVPMKFILKDDILYLNDLSLCPAWDLSIQCSFVEIDNICFIFENGQMLIIEIAWPEDGSPFVDSVALEYHRLSFDA